MAYYIQKNNDSSDLGFAVQKHGCKMTVEKNVKIGNTSAVNP